MPTPVTTCPEHGKPRHGLLETTAILRSGQFTCVCSSCKTLVQEGAQLWSCRVCKPRGPGTSYDVCQYCHAGTEAPKPKKKSKAELLALKQQVEARKAKIEEAKQAKLDSIAAAKAEEAAAAAERRRAAKERAKSKDDASSAAKTSGKKSKPTKREQERLDALEAAKKRQAPPPVKVPPKYGVGDEVMCDYDGDHFPGIVEELHKDKTYTIYFAEYDESTPGYTEDLMMPMSSIAVLSGGIVVKAEDTGPSEPMSPTTPMSPRLTETHVHVDVQIVRCTGLAKSDKTMMGKLVAGDPYCEVQWNGSSLYKTKVVKKSQDPAFEKAIFQVEVASDGSGGDMLISVLDNDGPLKKDDFLGQAAVTSMQLLFSDERTLTLDLEPKEGLSEKQLKLVQGTVTIHVVPRLAKDTRAPLDDDEIELMGGGIGDEISNQDLIDILGEGTAEVPKLKRPPPKASVQNMDAVKSKSTSLHAASDVVVEVCERLLSQVYYRQNMYVKAAQSYDARNFDWYLVPGAIFLALSTLFALMVSDVMISSNDELRRTMSLAGGFFSTIVTGITALQASHKLDVKAESFRSAAGKYRLLATRLEHRIRSFQMLEPDDQAEEHESIIQFFRELEILILTIQGEMVYFPSSKDIKEWIALGAMAPKDTDQPFSFFKEEYHDMPLWHATGPGPNSALKNLFLLLTGQPIPTDYFGKTAHIVSFKADLAKVDVAGLSPELQADFKRDVAAKLGVPEERIDFGVEVGSDKFHLNNRVAVVKVGLKDAAAAAKVEGIMLAVAKDHHDDDHLVDPEKFSHCTVSDVTVTSPPLPYLKRLALKRKAGAAARKQKAAKLKEEKAKRKARAKKDKAALRAANKEGSAWLKSVKTSLGPKKSKEVLKAEAIQDAQRRKEAKLLAAQDRQAKKDAIEAKQRVLKEEEAKAEAEAKREAEEKEKAEAEAEAKAKEAEAGEGAGTAEGTEGASVGEGAEETKDASEAKAKSEGEGEGEGEVKAEAGPEPKAEAKPEALTKEEKATAALLSGAASEPASKKEPEAVKKSRFGFGKKKKDAGKGTGKGGDKGGASRSTEPPPADVKTDPAPAPAPEDEATAALLSSAASSPDKGAKKSRFGFGKKKEKVPAPAPAPATSRDRKQGDNAAAAAELENLFA